MLNLPVWTWLHYIDRGMLCTNTNEQTKNPVFYVCLWSSSCVHFTLANINDPTLNTEGPILFFPLRASVFEVDELILIACLQIAPSRPIICTGTLFADTPLQVQVQQCLLAAGKNHLCTGCKLATIHRLRLRWGQVFVKIYFVNKKKNSRLFSMLQNALFTCMGLPNVRL